MWRFLASCASVEALVRSLEIGAGVLPVGIEEQIIEAAVEIIVMGDIALGAPSHCCADGGREAPCEVGCGLWRVRCGSCSLRLRARRESKS